MQRGVDAEKVFGRQEGKDPRIYCKDSEIFLLEGMVSQLIVA